MIAFEKGLQQARNLRVSVLDIREKSFFPLQKSFQKELDAVRAGWAAEDIPYAELASIRSALEDCAAAVATTRAVMFAFPGDDRPQRGALS